MEKTNRGRTGAVLCGIQGLLACFFLFAGGMKLVVPTVELLAAFVARRRWPAVAQRARARRSILQPAN